MSFFISAKLEFILRYFVISSILKNLRYPILISINLANKALFISYLSYFLYLARNTFFNLEFKN